MSSTNSGASATYFLNIGDKWYSQALNLPNPQFLTANESALTQTVANPFYHYLSNTLVPGPLWNQPTVTLSQQLVRYPQYGSLVEMGQCCAPERYNSFELKAQKVFSKGYNFLLTYVYIRERSAWNTLTDYSEYAKILFGWTATSRVTGSTLLAHTSFLSKSWIEDTDCLSCLAL